MCCGLCVHRRRRGDRLVAPGFRRAAGYGSRAVVACVGSPIAARRRSRSRSSSRVAQRLARPRRITSWPVSRTPSRPATAATAASTASSVKRRHVAGLLVDEVVMVPERVCDLVARDPVAHRRADAASPRSNSSSSARYTEEAEPTPSARRRSMISCALSRHCPSRASSSTTAVRAAPIAFPSRRAAGRRVRASGRAVPGPAAARSEVQRACRATVPSCRE